MIVVLLNAYIALLALFVWLRFIPFNTFWKLSPVLVLLVLLVGLFIPMGWGAPSGPAAVIRNSVQIIPSVAGEVVDVPVAANTPGQGRRCPVPDRPDHLPGAGPGHRGPAQARRTASRPVLRAAAPRHRPRLRRAGARNPRSTNCKAQLDGAKWNLDRTTVRAPADGYVTNLALRKGARVTGQSPVMAFIDTSEAIFGVEIPQISVRYVEVGQPVEITFKTLPGEVFPGKVETVLQAIATGQSQPGGLAVMPSEVQAAPFIVRIKLDDPEVARRLPAGSTGLAAIFTDHVKASHVIRQGAAASDGDPELRQSVLICVRDAAGHRRRRHNASEPQVRNGRDGRSVHRAGARPGTSACPGHGRQLRPGRERPLHRATW